jgi:pimeloyl-ACP methyl ester carboxylesterase
MNRFRETSIPGAFCRIGSRKSSILILLLWLGSLVRAAPQNSGYVREEHNTRVIVFVHGIFGTAESTWTCPTGQSWPRLLLRDDVFKAADIYIASYPTPYVGNRMTIDEIVASLKNRLDGDGVLSRHKQVIFVAHSMGGLIVQRFLLTYRDTSKQVPFIYFFSTPHTGTNIASLGHAFSADPLLRELLPGDQNDYLLNLETEWRAAAFQNIRRYCAYETQPYKGVLVVDRLSSTRNCDSAVPINANHVSIVKPCTSADDSYIALLNAWKASPATPDVGKSLSRVTASNAKGTSPHSRSATTTPQSEGLATLQPVFYDINDLSFSLVNRSDVTAQQPKYTIGIADLSKPYYARGQPPRPKPLPIPTRKVHDDVRPHQRLDKFKLMNDDSWSHVKNGDELFGRVILSCLNCDKQRYYWLYWKVGETGWYVEFPENVSKGIPFIQSPNMTSTEIHTGIEALVPHHGRIAFLATQDELNNPPKDATDMQPLGKLTELGWTVKPAPEYTVFEIIDKPLPPMEESVIYFRQLQRPFRLHLQLMKSIQGLNLLANVAGCKTIDINAGQFSDISELHGFRNLTSLLISQTPFSAVGGIVDISVVSSLSDLQELHLWGSRITDIEPLRKLAKIKTLSLKDTPVHDLSALSTLDGLESLDVTDAATSDLSPLSHLQRLTELRIDGRQLSSLATLSGIGHIERLAIAAHEDIALSHLSGLAHLEYLSVSIWGPSAPRLSTLNVAPLGGLTTLHELSLMSGFEDRLPYVTGAETFGELKELRKLALAGLQIADLGFLSSLHNLTELNITMMPVSSIAALRGLTSLRSVYLISTLVADISPLLELPALANLTVVRSPARSDILTELERRGVKIQR